MKERRQSSRIDSLNLVHVTCHDDTGRPIQQGIGRTINVSEKGILLETHFEIAPGERPSLSIGLEDELVDIRTRVIHRHHDEAGKSITGLSFGELDEKTLSVLKKYIKLFNEQHGQVSDLNITQ